MGRVVFQTAESLESTVVAYLSFLARVGRSANGAPLVPSLMVDLVWHVHQQNPGRYVRCARGNARARTTAVVYL